VEHETLAAVCTSLFVTHAGEEFDHVGDQVDVAPLPVLRRSQEATRVASPDTHDSLLEVDVAPAERQ